jgi:hypothetical protein
LRPMKTAAAARWLGLIVIVLLALAACGDDAVFEETLVTEPPEETGGTGTVPIAGPADWLTWSPAEAPGAQAEATLAAALEELGMAMIIPTSPPPAGGTTSATFNSHSLGYGSGQTFAGSTHISINIERGEPNYVIVTAPPWETPCGEGAVIVSFRGDDAACTLEAAEISEVWWSEAGQSFHASFRQGLTLSEGLVWLETWRLLP